MATCSTDNPPSDVCIFIAPQKMQKKRHQMMIRAMRKKHIKVVDQLSTSVTHVVTDIQYIDQAERLLKLKNFKTIFRVVSSTWITECLKAGHLVPVMEEHQLLKKVKADGVPVGVVKYRILEEYACKRITPLHHHNKILTDALEVLEKFADMRDEGSDYSRALAFRRAACTLKSLPRKVQWIQQIEGLPDVGDHVRRVVKEILDEGFCTEVEDILKSDKYRVWKEFIGIYGVGPATAKKWFNLGYRSVYDVVDSGETFDTRVTQGLTYHRDLSSPVTQHEAYYIEKMVRDEAEKLLPGVTIKITGGFRRGKEVGHDVDILISHPEEGKEKGILAKLLNSFSTQKIILHGNHKRSMFTEDKLSKMDDSKQTPKTTLDHFEKFIGIMQIPRSVQQTAGPSKKQKVEEYVGKGAGGIVLKSSDRDSVARRVDLIVVPYSQYYYALVGWTGSRQFNRSARLYAQRELNMKLTSHGLYDFTKGRSIPAKSEIEVFDNLSIPYREPKDRNC